MAEVSAYDADVCRRHEAWALKRRTLELFDDIGRDPRMFLLVLHHAKMRVPPSSRSWGGLALLECAQYRIPDTFGLTATS